MNTSLSSESYTELILEFLSKNGKASIPEIYDFIEKTRSDIALKEREGVDWRRSVRGSIRSLVGRSKIRTIKKGWYEPREET